MKTYTIAYGQVLYACVPDDAEDQIDAELLRVEGEARVEMERDGVIVECNLVLTNDIPGDEHRIVWTGDDLGCLTDENGTVYKYAIRAS